MSRGGSRLAGPYFDQVAALDTLRAAWGRVAANRGAAGGDGVTVERFTPVAESQIERLSRLLVFGQYRPGPARRIMIPKRGGGERPLDIPCVADRVVQAAVALVLDPVLDLEMEPSSFAYRRGRSVAQAVARVDALRRQGFDHVVDGDVRAYFESIPHERLIARLERSIDDPALIDLIWLWLEAYSLTERGIPQGSPLSPLLANLYLDAVDEAIEGRGVRLVRFADDFVLLCNGRARAEDARARMAMLLAEHGLELHPDKTRIVSFAEGFRFLGHVFARALVVKEFVLDASPGEDAIAETERALARIRGREADAPDEAEEPTPSRHAPRLVPVYLVTPGARLEARGTRLAVVQGGRISDLPPATIDRIEIGAQADATLAAMTLAAAHGIEVVRIDGGGMPVGRWAVPAPERAALHLAQAGLVLDPVRRAALACVLVDGRIANQRTALKRVNRTRRDPEIAATCVALARVRRKLRAPLTVDVARGVEGEAAALYWPALGRLMPETFRFAHRRRREAADPANILLDAAAGLLSREIHSRLVRSGLHTGFGVLHEPRDGEDALVHDLIEEFRAPLAETLVLGLLGRKALTPSHFLADPSGLRLTREGWAALIRGTEAAYGRSVRSPASGHETTWRGVIDDQVRLLRAHIESGVPYRPYAMDY